jgi:hypothetical protein
VLLDQLANLFMFRILFVQRVDRCFIEKSALTSKIWGIENIITDNVKPKPNNTSLGTVSLAGIRAAKKVCQNPLLH